MYSKTAHLPKEKIFAILKEITSRPQPFEIYNAEMLWDDDYISQQLLALHLDPAVDMVSRTNKFMDQSAEWMAWRFNIKNSTQIADFGCGPGLYAERFAQRGAKVTGIDISRRSIEYAGRSAAQKGLAIDYICQNYLEFRTEKKFDLICMIFCDLCALNSNQRRIMLQKFHHLLKDDGAVILDVYSFNQFNKKNEFAAYEHIQEGGFWSTGEYFGFIHTFKYEREKVVLDKYALIEKKGIRTFYNWLQYFDRESLKTLFESNGFVIESWYADVAGRPYRDDALEIAVVARKRKAK